MVKAVLADHTDCNRMWSRQTAPESVVRSTNSFVRFSKSLAHHLTPPIDKGCFMVFGLGLFLFGGCASRDRHGSAVGGSTVGRDLHHAPRGTTIPPAGFGVDLVGYDRIDPARRPNLGETRSAIPDASHR
jgi:hypothetical protein